MTSTQEKQRLRNEARERRPALARAVPDAGERIARNFLTTITLHSDEVVGGYIAAHDEIDPAHLIMSLRQRGVAIALPRVGAKQAPLEFHRWEKNAKPVKGAYGLFEASPDWPAVSPRIVLVPLLVFDRRGHRLGYGGGYYDRTLAFHAGRTISVGLAYAGQEVERLPADPWDQKLDWVVTEKGVRRFA